MLLLVMMHVSLAFIVVPYLQMNEQEFLLVSLIYPIMQVSGHSLGCVLHTHTFGGCRYNLLDSAQKKGLWCEGTVGTFLRKYITAQSHFHCCQSFREGTDLHFITGYFVCNVFLLDYKKPGLHPRRFNSSFSICFFFFLKHIARQPRHKTTHETAYWGEKKIEEKGLFKRILNDGMHGICFYADMIASTHNPF